MTTDSNKIQNKFKASVSHAKKCLVERGSLKFEFFVEFQLN
jgi:hypothetical protein